MANKGTTLLVCLVLLAGASVAVLFLEDHWQARNAARLETFQHLVGGLGFGPAVDLSGCALGFDPRLESSCAETNGPIPAGTCFCPRHAGSVFYYPPLVHEVAAP